MFEEVKIKRTSDTKKDYKVKGTMKVKKCPDNLNMWLYHSPEVRDCHQNFQNAIPVNEMMSNNQ